MAGHHKWDNLIKRMPAFRRARIERGVREDLAEMLLSEIRRLAGLTQAQLAKSLGMKQPSLAQMESQDDMQISTLRRIVEALDGELEIIVTLPTGKVSLSQFRGPTRRRKSA